jgi:hypothetical protein
MIGLMWASAPTDIPLSGFHAFAVQSLYTALALLSTVVV